MKVTIDQTALLKELALLQGIIERKATLPILSNTMLTAEENGKLTIVATDLEIGFKSSVAATVSKGGVTTVHARRFHDIVRRLPAGTIGFELKDGFLHLQTERIRYKLATQQPDQFPSLKKREGDAIGSIEAPIMADMIKRVMFAITTDDPRYSIGGALWTLDKDGLTMVATDGHRLSICRRPAAIKGKGLEKIVIPRKAIAELARLAGEHGDDARLWHGQGNLFAAMGDREVQTSLQEPRFPDFQRVIPKKNDKSFTIERDALKSAIERVAVLSQEHTHLVKIELDEGMLRVSAQHQQLGDAQQELAIEYSGEQFAIGFNAQYLLDYLAVAGTKDVRVRLGESMGQGLLEPVWPEADGDDPPSIAAAKKGLDKYIVMPMALS